MRISLLLVATLVVVILLLALLWRRECRRQGVATGPVLLWFPALLGLVAAAVFLVFGMPAAELRLLGDVHDYRPQADQLIAGTPLDALKNQEVPLLGLIHALQDRLRSQPSAAGWQSLSALYAELATQAGPQAGAVAVEAARRSLALAPDDAGHRLLLAQRLIEAQQGRLDEESRQLLEGVLAQHPDYDGAWLLLGLSAAHSEAFPLAEHALRMLLARHPDDRASDLLKQSLVKVQEQARKTAHFSRIEITVKAGKTATTGGTLFVSLQKAGAAGMPLAAKRVLVDRLPLTVVIERTDWLGELPDIKEALVAGGRYAQSAAADVAVGTPLVAKPLRSGPHGLQAEIALP